MAYIGREPAVGDYRKLDSTAGTDIGGTSFNGVLTTFPLKIDTDDFAPGRETQLIISINGIIQEPITAYTLSGANIVFTTAPATGSTFFGIALGDTLDIGVPSDNTVTGPKLVTGAVSANTKIANEIITTSNMQNNAITTSKILNAAVTYGKIKNRWKDVSTSGAAPGTTISLGDKCLVGTANNVVNITLPISGLSLGDEVEFIDSDGNWATQNATVHSGASTINIDSANNIVLNAANTSVRLVYVKANQWRSQIWS